MYWTTTSNLVEMQENAKHSLSTVNIQWPYWLNPTAGTPWETEGMEPFSSSTQVHGNRPIRMDNEDFTRLYNLKKSFGGCIIIIIIIMYNCTFHKNGSMKIKAWFVWGIECRRKVPLKWKMSDRIGLHRHVFKGLLFSQLVVCNHENIHYSHG